MKSLRIVGYKIFLAGFTVGTKKTNIKISNFFQQQEHLSFLDIIFGNHCSLYESRNVWVYTNRSGVYVRQVSTKARYGRSANESRWACTGSRLEPGLHSRCCQILHNRWGCPGSEQKERTKTRHKEQTSAQASLESGNEKTSPESGNEKRKEKKQTKQNQTSTRVRLPVC